MFRPALLAALSGLAAFAASPRLQRASFSRPKAGATYLYTYYDRQGRIVINNLPPSYVAGQGLVLKHVGVGKVRLAMSPAEMAKVLRSPELIALVDEVARLEGVDTYLARAIIQTESAFNYKARSHAGALGLMQLMPATAERFGVTDPFDPRQNITGGCRYLKWLSDYYQGDLHKVVAAYNAGEGAVNKYKGVPPFAETRAYVPKVLDLFQRRAVQADPKSAGSMALLKKGRGGFEVEEKTLTPDAGTAAGTPSASAPKAPVLAKAAPLPAPKPAVPEPQRASVKIYQWTDPSGRIQISDLPPPKGALGVKVVGGS